MAKGSSKFGKYKERKVREALRNPINVLKSLSEKSQEKSYKYQRLYRNLYNPEFYLLAYQNIYANKGSMTPGVDGMTIDGISMARINRIIESMRNQSYQPKPARREYIKKKTGNKKRPLGISSADDKLVQEVVRMILESIYEGSFSVKSHGFRPNKSCHTALIQIRKTFTGAKWFVEGDIKACFDSFDHAVLIRILRKRIEDEAFLNLICKFLKAGYMEQWTFNKTYFGIPQGSGCSPILADIYLNELDEFMQELKDKFDVGDCNRRKVSYEYESVRGRAKRLKKKYAKDWNKISEEERTRRAKEIRDLRAIYTKLPRYEARDENFKKIQYTRYCDDFLIGVIGSKEDAEMIKAEVKKFLAEELNLTLSDEKTKITHTSKCADFLGYKIKVSRNDGIKRRKDGVKSRPFSGVVKLYVPKENWVKKLLEYEAIKIATDEDGNEKWKAMHSGKVLNKSDIEILSDYNAKVRGLFNYYCIADNAYVIGKFGRAMKYSMMKTFAFKYKTKVSKIKKKYVKNGDFTVSYETKQGLKTSVFYNQGYGKRDSSVAGQVELLPQYKRYDRPNSLARKLKTKTCELCGGYCTELEIHQVKKFKSLKGNSEWERLMLKRRRKTLAVCPKCHEQIHSCDEKR